MREIYEKARDGLVALWKECRTPAFLAVVAVTAILVTRHYWYSLANVSFPPWPFGWLGGVYELFRYPVAQRQVMAFVLQLGVPVLLIWGVHRQRLRDFGLGLGDTRFWVPVAGLVFLVQLVVVWAWLSKDPTYVARYPTLGPARGGGHLFWAWETSRLFYMLSWEFLFRGYLLFALERRMGMLAVAVQMVPFAMMHIVSGKPVSEVYFTLLSGVLSGLLVLVSRSVWPMVLLHAMGAILLDIFIVFG
jgi:membrane protease YdiL (CAAX protease family)